MTGREYPEYFKGYNVTEENTMGILKYPGYYRGFTKTGRKYPGYSEVMS